MEPPDRTQERKTGSILQKGVPLPRLSNGRGGLAANAREWSRPQVPFFESTGSSRDSRRSAMSSASVRTVLGEKLAQLRKGPREVRAFGSRGCRRYDTGLRPEAEPTDAGSAPRRPRALCRRPKFRSATKSARCAGKPGISCQRLARQVRMRHSSDRYAGCTGAVHRGDSRRAGWRCYRPIEPTRHTGRRRPLTG
jgi:hypothetical protein